MLTQSQPNKGSSCEAVSRTTQDGQEQQQKQCSRDNEMFSLAGSRPPARKQLVACVDPEYTLYKPQYAEETREPVWSLAKPLPRVVRPGMRAAKDEDKEEQGKLSENKERPGWPSRARATGRVPARGRARRSRSQNEPT